MTIFHFPPSVGFAFLLNPAEGLTSIETNLKSGFLCILNVFSLVPPMTTSLPFFKRKKNVLNESISNQTVSFVYCWSFWKPLHLFSLSLFEVHLLTVLESEVAFTQSLIELLNDSLIPVNVHIPPSYPLIMLWHFSSDITHEFMPKINLKNFWPSQWSRLIDCLKSLWDLCQKSLEERGWAALNLLATSTTVDAHCLSSIDGELLIFPHFESDSNILDRWTMNHRALWLVVRVTCWCFWSSSNTDFILKFLLVVTNLFEP